MSNREPTAATNAAIKAELARNDKTRVQLATALREAGIAIQPSGVTRRLKGELGWKLGELQVVSAFLGVPLSTIVPDEIPAAVAS